jgi:exodeoxyribonuclease VII large subunit
MGRTGPSMNVLPSQRDLFPAQKIYTVSEITAEIKTLLEAEFLDVFIQGEISNFTAANSGHLYFVLKDKGAHIKCAFFRSKARFLKFKIEDGMQVIARGNLGVYELRGEYQLYVDFVEPKGVGSLQLAFEQLKARLQVEGLFDPQHKKPLPLLPHTIGIVTSPTGAAIQDILRILRRRHESVKVLIYPAKVQGEGSVQEIVAGIGYLNSLPEVDVMIVGRGGGSIEDLWAFNEEAVARAIFNSRIPIISAVGHEIDFTIADFVADLRAPTPSGAAELVISQKSDLVERVANLERRLIQHVQFRLGQFRNKILELSSNRVFATVEGRLRLNRQRSDELAFRLENVIQAQVLDLKSRWQLLSNSLQRLDLRQIVSLKREALSYQLARSQTQIQFLLRSLKGKVMALYGTLQALSPLAVLERGYAICSDSRGNILKEAQSLTPGDPFSVTLAKGKIQGRAETIDKETDVKDKGF